MLNEARYEQAQRPAPERPHMETNRWLNAIRPTRPVRAQLVPESETFDLLGVKLIWTKDGNRPFPEPVLNAIKSLLDFAELPGNWNSYGGRSLTASAITPVIQFVIRGHQTAAVPRLHPLPDGGVGLAWTRGEDDLEIAVAGNGTVEGLLSLAGSEEVELIPGSSAPEALNLLEQYLAAR